MADLTAQQVTELFRVGTFDQHIDLVFKLAKERHSVVSDQVGRQVLAQLRDGDRVALTGTSGYLEGKMGTVVHVPPSGWGRVVVRMDVDYSLGRRSGVELRCQPQILRKVDGPRASVKEASIRPGEPKTIERLRALLAPIEEVEFKIVEADAR